MGFNLTRFPVELHHQIMCAMCPEDLLALRQTSKHFYALTHEPRLWTALYYRMQHTHPFSCSKNEFAALQPSQYERLLVRTSKTAKLFETLREHAQHRIIPSGQTRKIGPLAALAFLSERFLLSVDDTTMVYLWDLSKLARSADAPAFPCARLALVGWKYLTHSMTDDHSVLYIVLSKADKAHIFSFSLPSTKSDVDDDPKLCFRDVTYFSTYFETVSGIDADLCLVLLHSYDHIGILNWRTKSHSTIGLLHSPRNFVLAVCICGPYVLCVRCWSIETYALPVRFLDLPSRTDTEGSLPVLQQEMPSMSFATTIRLSRVRCHRSSSGDVTLYTLCALAKDDQRGACYYQVRVQTAPIPALEVRVLGMEGAHADGRVSAWDLGRTGWRGAWVLAPHANKRHVMVFTSASPQYTIDSPMAFSAVGTHDVPDGFTEIVPRFETRVISIVSSWDSDDDVTKCAVSEFTGRIALGSRNGVITVV